MIAVRNLVGGNPTDMEAVVRQLDIVLQKTAITPVLRHTVGDVTLATTDVSVHFVPTGSVNRAVKKLADDGFPNGPSPSSEVLLNEGQRLTIRFRGNICAADGTTVREVHSIIV